MNATAANSIGASLLAHAEQALPAPQPSRARPRLAPQNHPASPSMHLTARQLEVLALLSQGLSNKFICRRLNIATGTVKVHMSCILRELGVASRLQAVLAARRLGLVGDAVADAPEPMLDSRLSAQPGTAAGRPVSDARYREAVAF